MTIEMAQHTGAAEPPRVGPSTGRDDTRAEAIALLRAAADVLGWPPAAEEPATPEGERRLDDALDRAGAALSESIRSCPAGLRQSDLFGLLLRQREIRHARQMLALQRRLHAAAELRSEVESLPVDEGLGPLLEHAAAEVGRLCGLDRTMVLLCTDHDTLVVKATFAHGDRSLADVYQRRAERLPITLSPELIETSVVRQGRPAVVHAPMADPHAFGPIVHMLQTDGYVVAPVFVNDEVVATLHGDVAGRHVETTDRDLLAEFAGAFGAVVERSLLYERVRTQTRELESALLVSRGMLEALGSRPARRRAGHRERTDPGTGAARFEAAPVPSAAGWMAIDRVPLREDRDAVAALSRREREVLEILATGATNAEIARRLVIAESTAKSHVKRILRKTGTSTRGQAVALLRRNG